MSKPQSGLTQWFKEKWVDLSRPKKGGGFEPCGREDARGGKYPKCVPAARAARMTPEQIESAIRRKRAAESREQREGKKPIMVPTIKKHAMHNQQSHSGKGKSGGSSKSSGKTKAANHAAEVDTALRKLAGDKVADTWKPLVSEAMKTWYGQGDMSAPIKVKGKKILVGGREINAQNVLDTMADALGDKIITRGSTFGEDSLSKKESKPVPSDPELYAKVKAEAKAKFDVYPSAYANGWLVREYKRRGGKYRVSKYNPNHDERGRFTSSSRAKTVVAAPKLSKDTAPQLKALAEQGGFTYNPKRKEVRKKGVAVAVAKKYEEVHDLEDFKKNGAQAIEKYMQKHSEKLAEPNAHLGAWVDKGKVYLDVSIVKGSLEEAAQVGRANDQIGIFDLATFTTWARTGQGGKYYPQKTKDFAPNRDGGRKLTYLDMSDPSIGKAERAKGVALVPALSLLDRSDIEEFVRLILSMEPISKVGDKPGHPFRGNQWITAGASAARSGKLKVTDNDEAVGHEKATAFTKSEYNELGSQVDEQAKSLTPDESSAFNQYYGDNYGGISKVLRQGGTPEFEQFREGNRYFDYMDEYVAGLDTGYQKLAVEIPRETTVYRGVFVPKGQEFQVGDVVQDKSYASTSSNSDVALRFAGSGVDAGLKPKGSTSVVLAIVLPKGQKAIVGGKQTPYRGEQEVLLDKGTKMKVVSVVKWKDPAYEINVEKVTVEIVP